MRFLRTTMILGGALASALVGTAAHAQCGGICVYEVGTPQMGSSYAGMAATAQDASTAFLNPAGMTRLDKAEYLQGLFAADVQLEFDNRNSVAPFGGNDGGNAAGFVPGGGGYLVLPIADELPFAEDFEYMKDLRFGLALNGLFGGTVDYSSSWLGRTFVTEADLQILNIQPGFGWRVTDWLSVGASLNVYRVELSKYRLRATPPARGTHPQGGRSL